MASLALPPLHRLGLGPAARPSPVGAPEPDDDDEPIVAWTRPAQQPAPPPTATQLRDEGYCVVPFIPASQVPTAREDFRATLRAFPEYRPTVDPDDPTQHYVQGGFGALGNPASFHNPFVRRLRLAAHATVVQRRVLSAMLPQVAAHSEGIDDHRGDYRDVRLEQTVDRMLFRRPSKSPSAESWHRDEALGCATGDEVFGGWVNLDDRDQHLSAVPRTHHNQTGNAGFKKVATDEAEWCNANKQLVAVPPGHLLVFNEKLLHEVRGGYKTYDVVRLFFGWRLTRSEEALGGSGLLQRSLEQQSVMRLKSGQIPKMYANMSWSQPGQRAALEEWSGATLRPECLTRRAVIRDPTEVRTLVHQSLPSLRDLGYAEYDAYEDWERRLLWPNRAWQLPSLEDGAPRAVALT